MKNTFKNITLVFVFILFAYAEASAQVIEGLINITLTPSNPKVGQSFTASVSSYSTDVDRASISWILDGKIIESGLAKKSIELTKIPNSKSLLVKLTSPEGSVYTGGVSLLEKSVSLIWEGGDSYVPAWYKGKKYLGRGGSARVAAIANISDGSKYLDNKDLIYTWEIDEQIQEKASGLGKSYADLYIADEYGDEAQVSVTVKSRFTGDSVKEVITVYPKDPNVIFYTLNKSNKSLPPKLFTGGQYASSTELSVYAEPYYFATDDSKVTNMLYSWSINGTNQAGPASYNRVFRLTGGKGYADISLYAENARRVLQDATREVRISF